MLEVVLFLSMLFLWVDYARCDHAGENFSDLPADTKAAVLLLEPFSFVDLLICIVVLQFLLLRLREETDESLKTAEASR